MKLIPTFFDGHFHGYASMKEITELRNEAHRLALNRQKEIAAAHRVYGFFSLNADGAVETARLYSGIPKTDREFDYISRLEKAHIYAIHRHD